MARMKNPGQDRAERRAVRDYRQALRRVRREHPYHVVLQYEDLPGVPLPLVFDAAGFATAEAAADYGRAQARIHSGIQGFRVVWDTGLTWGGVGF